MQAAAMAHQRSTRTDNLLLPCEMDFTFYWFGSREGKSKKVKKKKKKKPR